METGAPVRRLLGQSRLRGEDDKGQVSEGTPRDTLKGKNQSVLTRKEVPERTIRLECGPSHTGRTSARRDK